MNDYLQIRIETLEDQVSSSRKAGKALWGVLFLNIALILPNAYFLYSGRGSWVTGVSIGCVAMNALWMLIAIVDYAQNIGIDKIHLSYLKKRLADDGIDKQKEHYEMVIKSYSEMVKAVFEVEKAKRDSMANSPVSEPANTCESDSKVQSEFVPNCT